MPTPLLPDLERRDWTVEQVRALPDDGRRYEVIDGELFVTPAPSWLHQRAAIELLLLVRPYAVACALDCLIAPAEVTFAPRRSVQADLLVVPTIDGRGAARFVERWRPGDEEPEILVESLTWQPEADQAPLVVDLAAYFREVHGE